MIKLAARTGVGDRIVSVTLNTTTMGNEFKKKMSEDILHRERRISQEVRTRPIPRSPSRNFSNTSKNDGWYHKPLACVYRLAAM